MEDNRAKKKVPTDLLVLMIISIFMLVIGTTFFVWSIVKWHVSVELNWFENVAVIANACRGGGFGAFGFVFATSGLILTILNTKKNHQARMLITFIFLIIFSLFLSVLGFWFGTI